MNQFSRIVRYIAQNLCRIFTLSAFHLLYRLEYINAHNIPKKGGYVIAPNHSSYFDPPLIGSATFRPIRFMAMDKLFKSLIFGTLIRWLGAFPVRIAGVDRKSWNTFIRLVNNGECVMLFPEGARTSDGEIQPGKTGAGMLIYKARTRVIPVYAHGLFDIWPMGQKFPKFFKRIIVIYGKPIDFTECFKAKESKEVYLQITKKIIERIGELKKDVLAKLAAEKNG